MNIYIDLDNCLSKSYKVFIDYFNKRLSIKKTYRDFVVYDFNTIYGITQSDMWEIWDSIYSDYELFTNIEKEIGASRVTEFLNHHHIVSVLTSRPPHLKQVTIDWLARNKIHYHELYFVNKYGKEYIDIPPGCLVEDYLGYVDLIPSDMEIIVYDRPWNRNVLRYKRIKRLTELINGEVLKTAF